MHSDREGYAAVFEKPFLIVNMLDLSDTDIEQLKKFHKSYYNESDILSTAQELQITIQIKDLLTRNFQEPGEEFTRYFVRCLNDWKSTAKQIEQYKPILKKSIASVINDIIAERLNVAIKNEEQKPDTQVIAEQDENIESTEKQSDGVVTTQEELDAYNVIRSILRKNIDASKIVYKDFKSYFVIGVESASYWWVCRLAFGTRKKTIYIPTDDYKSTEKIDIDTIDDIFKYADKIEACGQLALTTLENWRSKHSK